MAVIDSTSKTKFNKSKFTGLVLGIVLFIIFVFDLPSWGYDTTMPSWTL